VAVLAAAVGLLAMPGCAPAERGAAIAVGSKKFTESVVLGEVVAHVAASRGIEAEHRAQLGGTRVLFEALVGGAIDVYPEYTGTIAQELLAGQGVAANDLDAMATALAAQGVGLGPSLGFNNTYALAVRPERARELGLERISDLRRHPELRLGFTNEFMDREDGWPSLRARYGLPHDSVRGLDHDLAYRGLAAGDIDVMDAYSTDAEIGHYGLQLLHDDLEHFGPYRALLLLRLDLAERVPELVDALATVEGRLDEERMAALNARVKIDGVPESAVAADFVRDELGFAVGTREAGRWEILLRSTVEHLHLVGVSLAAAVLLAIPLGVAAYRYRRFGLLILSLVGVVQTVPSLALLVFMIPLLGIGAAPAICALFLYSLLPIVRNTHAGLDGIAPWILESADALGLPRTARLWRVELPLASPSILAGIKTSAVINVGTATLGALIGAGGYGQPILTGIRLDDVGLIMLGAVPAAVMALVAQGLFDLAERFVVPRGLRASAAS
jgi:osmoprotectant transport system permease protein